MSNNTVFTATALPALVEGTAGMALPKPGEPVAAAKPLSTLTMSPWGSPITVDPEKGYWAIAIDPKDIYPNDEFGTFYELGDQLGDDDSRAVALHALLGKEAVVYEATKTKPAIVVGVLAQAGTFQTFEGPVPFEEGDVLLESPDIIGRMWPVGAANFAKKYDLQS